MRVLVTKGNGWYEDEVGKEWSIVRVRTNRQGKKEFIVWEDGGSNTWIDEDDCEIAEE